MAKNRAVIVTIENNAAWVDAISKFLYPAEHLQNIINKFSDAVMSSPNVIVIFTHI